MALVGSIPLSVGGLGKYDSRTGRSDKRPDPLERDVLNAKRDHVLRSRVRAHPPQDLVGLVEIGIALDVKDEPLSEPSPKTLSPRIAAVPERSGIST